MEKLKNGLVGVLLCTLACSNSHALTGEQLYQRCSSLDTSMKDRAEKCDQVLVNTVMCRWYVLGIADALIEAEKVCPPQRILDQQLALIASEYLDSHPGSHDMDAAELVEAALMNAYPCK